MKIVSGDAKLISHYLYTLIRWTVINQDYYHFHQRILSPLKCRFKITPSHTLAPINHLQVLKRGKPALPRKRSQFLYKKESKFEKQHAKEKNQHGQIKT